MRCGIAGNWSESYRLNSFFHFREVLMSGSAINAKKKTPMSQHGGGVRGDSLNRRSSSFEGLFGRIFRSLPPARWPKRDLIDLGLKMTADPEHDEKDSTLPSASPEVDDKRI